MFRCQILLLFVFMLVTGITHATLLSEPSSFTPDEPVSEHFWNQIPQWILETQRSLHRQLTEALHAVDEAQTVVTATLLLGLSFLYGIFHAAGPGHGKAIISTYLLTHRESLRRGLLLSVSASFLQGITAILLVATLLLLLGWMTRETLAQVRHLEMASFLLVSLLGTWLILRALRGGWRMWNQRGNPSATLAVSPSHPATPDHPQPTAHPSVCGCGHSHVVSPNSSSAWLPAVLAVGIRPCTGAVLVLTVSHLLDLWLTGVLAVLAMSAGTAITVAVLALLAVSARDVAGKLVGTSGSSFLQGLGPFVNLLGGLIILWIGLTLLLGQLYTPPGTHPLGF